MGSLDVAELLARYSYLAVLGLLTAAGVGAPVSEDLVLIAGGALVAKAGGSLPLMMLVGWVGVLVGDGLLFQIGARLGPRAAQHRRLARVLTPERVERVRRYYLRYGMLTVAVVRFIPGMRAATLLVSGSSGLPLRKFLAADAVAAMVSAPLLIWLGFRFGNAAMRDVTLAGRVLLAAALAGLVAFIAVRVVRRRRRARRSDRPPGTAGQVPVR